MFATFGIVSLAWMGPRFGTRQSQLDRQFQGRRHALERPADELAAQPFSSPEDRQRSLQPLYVILLIAVLAGWLVLWWQRFRRAARDQAPTLADGVDSLSPAGNSASARAPPEASSAPPSAGPTP